MDDGGGNSDAPRGPPPKKKRRVAWIKKLHPKYQEYYWVDPSGLRESTWTDPFASGEPSDAPAGSTPSRSGSVGATKKRTIRRPTKRGKKKKQSAAKTKPAAKIQPTTRKPDAAVVKRQLQEVPSLNARMRTSESPARRPPSNTQVTY